MARHEPEQPEAELLQGTLDLLILKVLALEPLHGYGIVQRLKQITQDALQVRQGSLYPALYRLEQRGFLKATWKNIAGRDAKFYALTKAGERRLETEKAGWERLTVAVRLVLETAKLFRFMPSHSSCSILNNAQDVKALKATLKRRKRYHPRTTTPAKASMTYKKVRLSVIR